MLVGLGASGFGLTGCSGATGATDSPDPGSADSSSAAVTDTPLALPQTCTARSKESALESFRISFASGVAGPVAQLVRVLTGIASDVEQPIVVYNCVGHQTGGADDDGNVLVCEDPAETEVGHRLTLGTFDPVVGFRIADAARKTVAGLQSLSNDRFRCQP
jgi:hypothetical protein